MCRWFVKTPRGHVASCGTAKCTHHLSDWFGRSDHNLGVSSNVSGNGFNKPKIVTGDLALEKKKGSELYRVSAKNLMWLVLVQIVDQNTSQHGDFVP